MRKAYCVEGGRMDTVIEKKATIVLAKAKLVYCDFLVWL